MIAIQQTMTLVGIRIWGGHVLVAGGTVTFNGCIFYDLELLTPLSDRIYFGGDVLVRGGWIECVGSSFVHTLSHARAQTHKQMKVLAGTVYFTGCAWFYTTVLGMENGVRFGWFVLSHLDRRNT